MSGNSHARDNDDPNDDNSDQGPGNRGPVSADGVSRVESAAAANCAEVPVTRPPPVSSGLISLCVVAGQHRRSADPVQLARALGVDPLAEPSEAQLLLAAKELGLKAKSAHSNWSRLPNNTLPAIAALKDGGYVVLLRFDPDGYVIAGDPRQPRPARLDR